PSCRCRAARSVEDRELASPAEDECRFHPWEPEDRESTRAEAKRRPNARERLLLAHCASAAARPRSLAGPVPGNTTACEARYWDNSPDTTTPPPAEGRCRPVASSGPARLPPG